MDSKDPCGTLLHDEDTATTDRQRCLYLEHLKLRKLRVNLESDCFLLEHINFGHSLSCDFSQAEPTGREPLVRKEVPFDQVHCLTIVDLEQPLLSPRHIRLIGVRPHSSSSRGRSYRYNLRPRCNLSCEVYQADLDHLSAGDQPMFAALSYVCGDQECVRRIRCGSKTTMIPQNVYDALLHVRLDRRTRLVWVDFLSIKQTDDREKSHQVALLHKIYAQAHVVCWLGLGLDIDIESVSFYIPLLARLWTTSTRASNDQDSDRWSIACKGREQLEHLLGTGQEQPLPPFSLSALTSVLTTGYFSRIWTTQEIILGKTKTCKIGTEEYSIAVFTAAMEMVDMMIDMRSSPAITLLPVDQETRKTLSTARNRFLKPALRKHCKISSEDFFQDFHVVTSLRANLCSDPRDRIYGLLSLFRHPDDYSVDYKLSLPEVFADFTVHCMLNEFELSVLNNERHMMDPTDAFRHLRRDIPSWCPDWTIAGGGSQIRFRHHRSEQHNWRASRDRKLICTRPSKIELAVTGLTVSRLKKCSSSVLGWVDTQTTEVEKLTWLERGESLCTLFEGEGNIEGHVIKNSILNMFDHVLIPTGIKTEDHMKFSVEMCSLLEQTEQPNGWRDLLVPVYLAKADPKLFITAGFEIDPRIPRGDFAEISSMLKHRLKFWSSNTKPFLTMSGNLGTGYPGIQEGDILCIMYGSPVPQVVRAVDDTEHYNLIGACYVEGLMFGEGLHMGLAEKNFILV